MNKLKASLNLYFNSWKHSFNLFSEETAGEYKNFINISLIILLLSLFGFFTLYEEQPILIDEELSIIKIYLGIAIFWCYMTFAIFPFAGIISRRLHSHNIDINQLTTILNKKGIYSFLILSIIYLYLSPSNYISIYNLLYIPYTSVLFYPIYTAFIVLGIFCWNLFDINKIKKQLNQTKKYKYLRCLWFFLTFITFTQLIGGFDGYSIIVSLISALLIYILIKHFTTSLIISTLIIAINIPNSRFYYWALTLLIIFLSYITKKFLPHSNNKISYCLKLYTPLVLLFIILPLNISNPSTGSLGMTKNFLTGANYVKQDIHSIGDKHINALSIPLLKALSKQKQDQNFLISTHNIYQGLGLLANGASGETLEKLKNLLGSQNLDEINSKSKEIIEHHSTSLKFKNTLSIKDKKHLTLQFKNALKQYDTIKPKTNKDCKIDYSSSLEFASSWKTKFGQDLTNHTFHTPSKDITVPMMKDTREVYIAQGENFRILALPYKSGDNFYIILPSSKDTPIVSTRGHGSSFYDTFYSAEKVDESPKQTIALDEVIEKLTPETFSSLKFEKHKIELMIPTFEFSENVNLKTALTSLGLENLFAPLMAELNNVLSSEANTQDCSQLAIHIESFNQKNKIKVNETGTAAISYQQIGINYATGSMMNISDPFIVDRPFIFMINNGAFMGIINDPTQKGDSF